MKKGFLRRGAAMGLSMALLAGGVPAAMGEANEDAFAQKLHGMYDEIEVEYRPDVRWWLAEGLNTDDTLRKNIQAIYDSGFGAAEFLAMPESGADDSIYGWGSDEWTADTQLIIEEASKRGMGFSLTSGTHWSNANLPDTYQWEGETFDAENRGAAKELDYATIVLKAGEQFNGILPVPVRSENANYKVNLFQSVVSAKLLEAREGSGQEYGFAEGTGTGIVAFDSLTDISKQVVAHDDGSYTLDWTAPDDGDYALFVYWMHGSGQTASPSVANNYVINYVDRYGVEALIDYWETNVLTPELKEIISESGRGEVYMDSLELRTYGAGGNYWGYDFRDEFIKRKGYDLTPYLPLICKDGVGHFSWQERVFDYNAENDEKHVLVQKIRNDFDDVMTAMYTENVLQPLQEWLHGLNMKLRAEPSYGMHYEISTPAAYIDGIETESFAQAADVDLYRGILGSANMYGRLFSSETGAVYNHNYYYNMDEWTQLCYLQFVDGVNRTVFHGYSAIEGSEGDTKWPGHEGMYPSFSERFNERQPASEMYPAWTDMLARNQKVLRQGTPSRDLAILRTDYFYMNYYDFRTEYGYNNFTRNFMMNDKAFFWKDLTLQQNGYTYDYFSPQLLEDENNVTWTDSALQPDGPAYQAIIVYQEAMELSSAKKLLEIAEAGLPILFVNNNTETYTQWEDDLAHSEAASMSKFFNNSDEDVQAVVSQIKALDNVKTVNSPADVMDALQEMGVYPRVAYTEPNNKFLTISREDAENSIHYTFAYSYKFASNKDEDPYTTTLSFAAAGKPYEIDDWTGKVNEIAAYEIVDGRTNVTVTLAPGESMLIAIDETNDGSGLHAVSTTAEDLVLKDGTLAVKATVSGEYETMLSTGETVTKAVSVPETIALPTWDIVIQDWNEGNKVVNTEEKFGHVTEEVYYETAKTELSFPQSDLVAWKDLPATDEQLATLAGDEPSMAHVSGIGYYSTTFEVPADWAGYGALLKIDSTNGSLAEVTVNGQVVGVLDTRELTLDISDCLSMGENVISIKVASTLTNRMIQREYSGFPDGSDIDVQDYGLTGEVAIVPYIVAPIN